MFYASAFCFVSENLTGFGQESSESSQESGLGVGDVGRSFDDLPYMYLSTNHDNISIIFKKTNKQTTPQIQNRSWLKTQAHFRLFWGRSQVFHELMKSEFLI